MNTILAMVLAVLMVVLTINTLITSNLAKKAYKRDEEFQKDVLNQNGIFLVSLWWYDKKDFTHRMACGSNVFSAIDSMILSISKESSKQPNEDYAIVNIIKVE